MRHLALALCLASAACATPLTQNDIEVVFNGVLLPGNFLIVASFTTLGDTTSCPKVTETAPDVLTVTGGCTKEDTAWRGTAVFDDSADPATVTLTDFGMTSPEASLIGDGAYTITEANKAVGDLTLAWGTGDAAVTYTYEAATIDPIDEFANALFGQEGAFVLNEGLEVEGIGAFHASGSFTHQGTCEGTEIDQGTVTVTGPPLDDILFTWDGATACDGCVGWAYNGESDSICR